MSSMYPASGGPLDGQSVPCRYPDGVVCADRPAGRAWVYDLVGSELRAREADGRPLDDARALEAGLGVEWDVIAVPGPHPDEQGGGS